MTRHDYDQLVKKIVTLYQARVDEYAKEMASEREKDLQAVARVWKLENGEDQPLPPLSSVSRRTKHPEATNGDQPISQKQRIRKIIDRLPGPIDSAKVVKTFGEVFPDDDQPESSTVSKVFREMLKEDKLKCTKAAGFQQPAQFEKI